MIKGIALSILMRIFVKLGPINGQGMQLSLKVVTSLKARRHQLDLFCDDMEKEVERLIEIGATRIENWQYEEDADYTVLEDCFCVVQKIKCTLRAFFF